MRFSTIPQMTQAHYSTNVSWRELETVLRQYALDGLDLNSGTPHTRSDMKRALELLSQLKANQPTGINAG